MSGTFSSPDRGRHIFADVLARYAAQTCDGRLGAVERRVRAAVRVAVTGRQGVGPSSVAAALSGAGHMITRDVDGADVHVRVIAEALKPEDESALRDSSVPAVVVSLIMLFVFGYTLGWFPNGYAADPLIDPAWNWEYISSVIYHGTLPMATLVFVLMGGFAVTMRNNMINLLGEDYIVMARAKGLSDNNVMLWYAARNALLPTVSSLAIAIGTVLGGSLVTEVVFNYPGLGNTLYQAIIARDYPVIQGQLLIMTAAMLISNFVVDLSYVLLDPRLKKA